MPITALPTPPLRTDPTNFADRGDALLGALPAFVTEANALQTDVNARQVTASAAAVAAAASQAASVVASGTTVWVSGTTYAIGDCRFSPISFQSFRRKIAGAGTTDPSLDGTNWQPIAQIGEAFSGVTSTATTLVLTTAHLGQLVKVTATGATLTFPAIGACPAGSIISVIAEYATGTTTLKGNAAELLANTFGVTANTFTLNAGEAIQYVSNGASWDPLGYETNYSSGIGGSAFSFRNKIINGGCLVAQRGNAALTNGLLGYGGSDRLYGYIASLTAAGTLQQLAVPVANLSRTGVYQAIGNLTTTGTGTVLLGTRLEYRDVGLLNSKAVTVSVNVYQDTGTAQSFAIRVSKANTADNFAATTVLATSAGTSCAHSIATPITFTLALGANDASNGLQIDVISTTFPAVTGKFVGIGDFQVEQGSIATPFEVRPYALEMMLCQRYYASGVALGAQGYVTASSSLSTTKSFACVMRSVPTIALSSTSYVNSATASVLSLSAEGFSVQANGTVIGNANFFTGWSAAAEL